MIDQRESATHSQSTRSVLVHSGARDGYQLARALDEAGMLDTLVTDLSLARRSCLGRKTEVPPATVSGRQCCGNGSNAHVASARVKSCAGSGITTLLLDKLPGVPFALRRRAARHADATLGRAAGALAARHGSHLVSYSYYAFDAFTRFAGPGILFQLHPHPLSMRRILGEELAMHPDCAESLRQEWELSLPEDDFMRLVQETTMPTHILAASTFTKTTLVENGTDAADVSVIPYGVDCERFSPAPAAARSASAPLRLLFVGRINQRKGVKYLLEAMRLLATKNVHLTVCGRVVDGLDLFKPFASQVDIRPSVSNEELIRAYQEADLFVFPSVAEGFGQVLLESLASGLPILSTTHTAAPDLIEEGNQGFVIEPRQPGQIAERIDWALTHRPELAAMRERARERAEHFTWERFRAGAVEAIRMAQAAQTKGHYSYV